MSSEQSTQAERQRRHRAGVRTDLRDIRRSLPEILAEVQAIRRDVDARLAGLLDNMADGQREQKQ